MISGLLFIKTEVCDTSGIDGKGVYLAAAVTRKNYSQISNPKNIFIVGLQSALKCISVCEAQSILDEFNFECCIKFIAAVEFSLCVHQVIKLLPDYDFLIMILHSPTPVITVISPKMIPPNRAALGSPSPRLVPTKAMVKPHSTTHIPRRSHFQKGRAYPRSSAQNLNPIINKQAKIPSKNQNNPLVKNCMFSS